MRICLPPFARGCPPSPCATERTHQCCDAMTAAVIHSVRCTMYDVPSPPPFTFPLFLQPIGQPISHPTQCHVLGLQIVIFELGCIMLNKRKALYQ